MIPVPRPAARLACVLAPLALLVAACGSGGDTSTKERTITDVTVKGGFTSAPKVDFPQPYSVKKTQTKVLQHGSGATIALNSVITIKLVEYVGRDGGSVGADASTALRPWTATSKPYTFALTSTSAIKGLRTGLVGAKGGDVILFSIAPKDAYDPTGNGTTVSPGDSIVAVVDVLKVTNPLTIATGTKASAPATVPAVKVNAKNIPTGFTAGSGVAAKVAKLGVYPVIKGRGAKVRAGQTISVQYLGELYPAKKIFDQSWTKGAPLSFTLGEGQVITGWDRGLVGQRVGSRVILTIPSALGYGKNGSGTTIPKNADLIFVVDILGAY